MTQLKLAQAVIRFEDQTSLEPTDFQLPESGTTVVRSPDSSHRAEFLKTLLALHPLESGQLLYEGRDLSTDRKAQRRYRIEAGGYFEDLGLLVNLSVEDNLLLPLEYHATMTRPEAALWVHESLKRSGLEAWRSRRPAALPAEVRKICCLLRALVLRPRILICEEPTHGLGHTSKRTIAHLLSWHREHAGLELEIYGTNDSTPFDQKNYFSVSLEEGRLHVVPGGPA